ncbi:MAG: F0F1 ATP synthase subunit B [Emergencia sp.]|nr:F0F1 ATP synthase subunit B [Emergencia sp.]
MKMVQPLLSFNWNLVFTAVTVIVLYLILKHFFFEKVHQFMIDREKNVQASLDHAEEVNRNAEEQKLLYEAKMAGAEAESRQLLKAARDEAKVQAKEIIDDAGQKARDMIEHSQKEIRREQFNARKELQEEVGSLAILAAEKILEKDLTEQDHEELVNKIIEEADAKPWS